ncbi:hypothetical protein ACFW04_010216 [Cataglyphis niger]
MSTNDSRTFTVENNVYKGEEISKYNYKSIGEIIWNKIKSYSNKIVHLDACTEQVVTYAELQDKIVRCALWLQKQGIKPNDVISVCTSNHLNSIVPCLAAIYINAIFNPWNENMDLKNTLHVIQLTTPKVIFCTEKSINVILRAIKESNSNYDPTIVIFCDRNFDVISFSDILNTYSDGEVATFQYIECNDMKKTMCILHSSGTTGPSKGVELSNYCLLNISEDKNIDFTNAVSIWFSSLYWITGIIMNLMAIAQGAKIIIYPEFDEEMLCLLIEKYKITTTFLSTSMMNRSLKAGYIKKFSLSSLKVITFSGAKINAKVQEEMRCILPHVEILQVFGRFLF